ncbi:MAG: nitrous oxide reductase accessory protein NosL [Phycisphaeraceae bacterium]|nr:nitrous oxide reductase accessory protein NosL [Phycisphaeraceae bacterium]
MMHRLMVVLVLFAAAICGSCRDEERIEPPALHLGAQECDFCRMMVSDGRFAAACIVRESDGRLTSLVFDDIGCLLRYEAEATSGGIVQRYVTDYESEQWLTTEQATIVQSEQLHTPMACGIAACATSQAADRLLAQFPGRKRLYRDLVSHDQQTPATP